MRATCSGLMTMVGTVGTRVAVEVGTEVRVGLSVSVGLAVADAVSVAVAVRVAVLVAVGLLVCVLVKVDVELALLVAVGLADGMECETVLRVEASSLASAVPQLIIATPVLRSRNASTKKRE